MAVMGPVGIEPTRVFSPEDFKSPASACSATAPCLYSTHKLNSVKDKLHLLRCWVRKSLQMSHLANRLARG